MTGECLFFSDPRILAERDPVEETPIVISFLPFFHAMAFISQLILITFGGKSIVMKKFNEDILLRSIEKYKVRK